MKVFKYKKDAEAWTRDMKTKSVYYSASSITEQFINYLKHRNILCLKSY